MMSNYIIKGGNGNVELSEDIATKTLRNTGRENNIKRFLNEVRVIKQLSDDKELNIVEILEVCEDIEHPINSYIKMKRYDGTVEDLLHLTKGNLLFTFQIILPIIKTLHKLAERENPIYHRDLKPDNILYRKEEDEYYAVLTDFGICYVNNSEERLTPQEISIGPRFFMAPEYEVGKVENVTCKGDIFSLGKLIWWLLWGEKGYYMPSNLWYIKEYDLYEKYHSSEMIFANYIISTCLKIDPNERISYDDLIVLIEGYMEKSISIADVEKRLKVELYQEKRNIELVEIKHMNRNIVNIFSRILIEALEIEIDNYPNFDILAKIRSEYNKKSRDGISYTSVNVDNNCAHYLYSMSYDKVYCAIDYNPAKVGEKYANITFRYTVSSNITNSIKIYYSYNTDLHCIYRDGVRKFDRNAVVDFLEDMISDIIVN